MNRIYVGLFGLILICGGCSSTGRTELRNDAAKTSYSVGYQVGSDFKTQNAELYPDALVQGVQDALTGTPPQLTKDEMNTTLIRLKKQIVATEKSKGNLAGAAFLAENAKRQGVTTLSSGVQYKILRPGNGKRPAIEDSVKIHYRISKLDGTEIGNTYIGSKPRTVQVNKAIPGLQEILLLMDEGAKWQVFLPTASSAGGQEPMDEMGVLNYDIELLSVREGSPSSKPPVETNTKVR